MNIQIKNGRILCPATQCDHIGDVFIIDKHIAALDQAPETFVADKTIDATGQYVLPGLVDMYASAIEPDATIKASLETESLAALAGGVTTFCTPADMHPIINTPADVEYMHQKALQAGNARVYSYGAMTQDCGGKQLTAMAALIDTGAVGIGHGDAPLPTANQLKNAFNYAASDDILMVLHPIEISLSAGLVHEGQISARYGLAGILPQAETIGVAMCLMLAEQTGVRLHLNRLTCAASIDRVREAKAKGLPVTCDISILHCYLTELDLMDFNTYAYVLPPFRTERDRLALIEGIRTGVVDAICSNHCPQDSDVKRMPFGESLPGASTLESLLPLVLKLIQDHDLNLLDTLSKITHSPANCLGLSAGQLSPHSVADICIVDPECDWQLEVDTWQSAGKNSPLQGWTMYGRVTHTLVDGKSIYTARN